MKKTNEDLLEFFGLKIGDKVKIKGFTKSFVIVEEDVGTLTDILLNCDYEVIKPKKKIGDIKCGDITCIECPFRLSRGCEPGKTLSEIFETHEKDLMFIYDSPNDVKKELNAIKVELDKEVEECEK